MFEIVRYAGFVVGACLCLLIYVKRACRYSRSILEMPENGGKKLLLLASLFFVWLLIDSGTPVIVTYLFVYSALLIWFLESLRNSLMAALFASGTFLFHIANLYMLLFGVFAISCDIRSMDRFQESYLYPAMVLLVILAAIACLDLFARIIDREAIQILIENKRQLHFATMSLMFIDIYLFVLSAAYNSKPFTNLLLLFFIVTSVLLFGAFYTAFNHAVRMSMLEVYETRSHDLEMQLEQSNRDIGELQSVAYIDPLTGISNRRYGLSELKHLLEAEKQFTVCMVDLDGLKFVNDAFGHGEGDRYLVAAADALEEAVGWNQICRLGGDEFLAILPDKKLQEAEALMEQAQRKLTELFNRQEGDFAPSFSYGVVEAGKTPLESVSELLGMADRKMYEMKEKRNRRRKK